MEKKDLFTAGIFYTAVLALLFTGINTLLNAKIDPLKYSLNTKIELLEKNQERFEAEQKEIKAEQKEIRADVEGIRADVEGIRADVKEIKDFLLSGKTASVK